MDRGHWSEVLKRSGEGPLMDISEFLAKVSSWAASQPDIVALALVGSHARGTASVSSDIDLVILVANPDIYLDDTAWVGTFGQVKRQQLEEWGQVSSLRVWYADGREVEFGVTDLSWAANPIDEGTASVIAGGIQVLYERDRFLSARIGDKEHDLGEVRLQGTAQQLATTDSLKELEQWMMSRRG